MLMEILFKNDRYASAVVTASQRMNCDAKLSFLITPVFFLNLQYEYKSTFLPLTVTLSDRQLNC